MFTARFQPAFGHFRPPRLQSDYSLTTVRLRIGARSRKSGHEPHHSAYAPPSVQQNNHDRSAKTGGLLHVGNAQRVRDILSRGLVRIVLIPHDGGVRQRAGRVRRGHVRIPGLVQHALLGGGIAADTGAVDHTHRQGTVHLGGLLLLLLGGLLFLLFLGGLLLLLLLGRLLLLLLFGGLLFGGLLLGGGGGGGRPDAWQGPAP